MSDIARLMEFVRHPAGSSNDEGVMPPSATNGWAITSNYGGDGAVDFWNTTDPASEAAVFNFRQKTGPSTNNCLATLVSDGAYSEMDFATAAGDFLGAVGGDANGSYLFSFTGKPVNFHPGITPTPTISMPATGGIAGLADGVGVLPASATTGWAITSNYGGAFEVDLWNTAEAGGGFFFRQKLAPTTEQLLGRFCGDAASVELDIIDGAGEVAAFLGYDATGGWVGAANLRNFGVYAGTGGTVEIGAGNAVTVTFPAAGGIVVGAPTGGSKGAGTINAVQVYANNVLLTSDAALKRDVETLPDCLALVMAIEPKSYRLDAPDPADRRNWGFIAQDVAARMAEAGCDFGGVVEDEGGHALSYADMIAVLWKAVQELAEERKKR